MQHISEMLKQKTAELRKKRDSERMLASEVALRYITDHHDREAFKRANREATKLARAWDQMVELLDRTADRACGIERKCENFYGD